MFLRFASDTIGFKLYFATQAEQPVLWVKETDFRHDFSDRITLYVN